ncbi:ATP-binding protein [Streptomyces lunaelactis]|uniref:ATP-binding protein n=1 Tax=Streptomyces lunaelactis TaxID=1535768 RepID=UPI001584D574|nr:ATP-binding protein [Streptomyces lunaelactis]NUK01519.1 ATP-binding protein [Streptomyces lunaelactis]NUK06705.1 ATP-binding protein [Streptomyces lunaelactis]NUK14507.1 ATP-binding protein [Streptomyces lunaelactis]NUK23871.1 ATP-binding protein [Streptomyces lunaelactis]NUK33106.1 ATP-binding protein [Streptomyces lunaelactis]
MNAEPHVVIEESPCRDSAGARRATAEFLLQHCDWADLDAVLLVVSELVTNAVRHTAGWWRLHLTAGQDTLVVEMDDSSPLPPVPREPDFTGGGGFGWHMVLQLAGRVEVCPLPDGKRVQATWIRPMSPSC